MTPETTEHSPLGASGAGRWIACPGSIAMCASLPDEEEESDYASEGSAAHALAAAKVCHPRAPYPRQFVYPQTRKAYPVTAEMVAAIDLYVSYIRGIPTQPWTTVETERLYHLDHLHPHLWGTADCVHATWDGTLYVIDFKYGAHVRVPAKGNVQLGYYALGALQEGMYADVVLGVVQPRAGGSPVRTYRTTPERLEAWGRNVLLPAALRTEEPNAPRCAGEHCNTGFCAARKTCPEHMEWKLRKVFG